MNIHLPISIKYTIALAKTAEIVDIKISLFLIWANS
jgi:hypothetical protein